MRVRASARVCLRVRACATKPGTGLPCGARFVGTAAGPRHDGFAGTPGPGRGLPGVRVGPATLHRDRTPTADSTRPAQPAWLGPGVVTVAVPGSARAGVEVTAALRSPGSPPRRSVTDSQSP